MEWLFLISERPCSEGRKEEGNVPEAAMLMPTLGAVSTATHSGSEEICEETMRSRWAEKMFLLGAFL